MTRKWLVLAGLGLSFGGIAAIACSSSSDNQAQNNSETDASPDSTTGGDGATPDDSSSPSDSSTRDASTPTDAGVDAAADSAADGSACVAYDASALDDASVAAGFTQVWQVYRCYGCHQSPSQTVSDAGAGIVLSGNNAGLGDSGTIFPPNLTRDPSTGLGCWSDSQIRGAILNGIDDEGRTLCKPMPKFGQAMFTADGGAKAGYPMDAGTAQEIVDYLRSLPVVVNQVSDTTCPSGDAGIADAAEQ
jgi:hypothetical protein